MFRKQFMPYAEYSVRIRLSPEEFRARLEKECCRAFEFTVFPTPHLRGCGLFEGFSEVVLEPVFFFRNPFRGLVYIKPEKIPDSAETLLLVTVKPNEHTRYLLLFQFFLFAVVFLFFLLNLGWPAVFVVVFAAIGWLWDRAWRESAKSEVPEIQRMLDELLRKIGAL